MKRTGMPRRNSRNLPIAWHLAESAMLRANAADTCDARVSEDVFDAEDAWTEVDIMVHCKNHGLN